MSKELNYRISSIDYLGCFGNFSMVDPVCKKHCALRLRCAIESDQKEQMEILEDLASIEDYYTKSN